MDFTNETLAILAPSIIAVLSLLGNILQAVLPKKKEYQLSNAKMLFERKVAVCEELMQDLNTFINDFPLNSNETLFMRIIKNLSSALILCKSKEAKEQIQKLLAIFNKFESYGFKLKNAENVELTDVTKSINELHIVVAKELSKYT